jgi:hypothetical protein
MKKSIKVDRKRRGRGRPPTGRTTLVSSRFPSQVVAAVKAWAAERETTRSDAIRRLVELGLETRTSAKPGSKVLNKTRAAELAAKVVDKMIDPTAPADERDRRRRRLTKGPPEFREDRVDLPKAKGK